MFSEVPGKVSTEVLIERKKKKYVKESKSINKVCENNFILKTKAKKIF